MSIDRRLTKKRLYTYKMEYNAAIKMSKVNLYILLFNDF